MYFFTTNRRTVSRTFYDILVRALPGLDDDIRYWAFTDYLLHTRFRDKTTGNVLIPSATVQHIGGKFRAEPFLDEYSNNVMPITWSGWNHLGRECRQLTHIGWPEAVLTAIVAERAKTWQYDERVYILNGLPLTAHAQQRDRIELLRLANEHAETAQEAQRRLLRYLNDRSSRLFTAAVKRYIADATKLAWRVEDDDERWNAHMTLRAIQDQSKPFYRPSRNHNTVRVFGLNESMLHLPKHIRRCLTRDWVELDLRSAQFAIAAMMWNIEPIQVFLQAGGTIWHELDRYLDGRAPRDALKEAVYRIANGGSKRGCIRMLDDRAYPGAGRLFFRHPLIRALWRAKQQAVLDVIANRGAHDCFGNWIPFVGNTRKNNVGSIIAQQAQAYELRVMLAVLDLAERTDAFSIALWQHDGCSIAVHDKRRRSYWVTTISNAVNERAYALQIYTTLEQADQQYDEHAIDPSSDVILSFIDD
jgi:hypothetical protein